MSNLNIATCVGLERSFSWSHFLLQPLLATANIAIFSEQKDCYLR